MIFMFAVDSLAAPRNEGSAPPKALREFRGVWVATVGNIDWPSKPGLSTDEQKKELIAILDKCVGLNLNAVIFQVRTQADALYDSKLEPWSEYLTGKMGQAPNPYYDPLEFAVEEAHRRGLQLHAWFNPYRVRMPKSKSEAAENHVSVSHPDAVRKYGEYLWLDPAAPEAEEQFIAVLTDVVKRYDVDGVHIDDYFYPYQVKDKADKIVPFPDDETYKRAVAAGGQLKRDDWRRQNVDHLIKRMYDEVKKLKPWVLVGTSPFGIWRPGYPTGVTGLDQYATLYSDARKWQQEGWVDYMTPQIYWRVGHEGQPYEKLLAWWAEQNVKERHLWPGNFTSKIGVKPEKKDQKLEKKGQQTKKDGQKKAVKQETPKKPEKPWTSGDVIRQIEVTRSTPGATGNVHFSMKALMKNKEGIADKLKELYAEPALVPESTWLGRGLPGEAKATARTSNAGVTVDLKLLRGDKPWLWLVRVRTDEGWKMAIVPGDATEHFIAFPNGGEAKLVMVTGVSRTGTEGQWRRAPIVKSD
jgi:uncharacterized lipoprotein YddW (UPF0748 family)